jgi:hypothetical protein
LVSKSRILTIAVVVLGIVTAGAVIYSQYYAAQASYNSEITYSFAKSPESYDYSCDVEEYQIFFTIKNVGQKNVVDLSASITDPDCVGGTPDLPGSLNASSMISFFAQTTSVNGTLTFSGNNTFVAIKF